MYFYEYNILIDLQQRVQLYGKVDLQNKSHTYHLHKIVAGFWALNNNKKNKKKELCHIIFESMVQITSEITKYTDMSSECSL